MKKIPTTSTFAALVLAALAASCGALSDARGSSAAWCASPRGAVSPQALARAAQRAADAPPHDEIVLDVWRSAPRGTAVSQAMLLHAETRDPQARDHVAVPAPPPPMPVVYTDGGLSRYGLSEGEQR